MAARGPDPPASGENLGCGERSSGPGWGSRGGFVPGVAGGAEDGGEAALDVNRGGGPGGDADAHGGAPLPGGAAAPAGAVGLDAGDHPAGGGVVAEGDEDLVEDDVVEHGVARRAQTRG